MKKLNLVIASLGLIGLVSGCNYSSKPFTIHYQKPAEASEDTTVAPADSKTDVEGTTVAGDETITPTGGDAIRDDAATPVPAPGMPAPATSETDDGDLVSDDTRPTPSTPTVVGTIDPDLLRPANPAIPALRGRGGIALDLTPKCYKQFAYVNQIAGVENIVVFDGESTRSVTSNTYKYRSYSDLAFKPNSTEFAFTDFILAGIIPLQVVTFRDLASLESEPRTLDADAYAKSLTWSADGLKYVYIAVRGTKEEIRLVDVSTSEPRMSVVVSNESDPSIKFDKVTWVGDQLIYASKNAAGNLLLDTVYWDAHGESHSFPLTYRFGEGVYAVGESVEATDATGSPDGSKVAFVVVREGKRQLAVCDFVKFMDDLAYRSSCTNTVFMTQTGDSASPAWSPDAKSIYYSAEQPAHPGTKEIYRVNPENQISERLTVGEGDKIAPAVVPVLESCGE